MRRRCGRKSECPSMTRVGRRGPTPKKEMKLARAWQTAKEQHPDNRPTAKEVADRHGVTVRQLYHAYAKHGDGLQQESDADTVATLTANLRARDAMSPRERKRHDDALDARVAYEDALRQQRSKLVRRRSKRKG